MDNDYQNHHTIFVDSPDEVESWSAVKYFDTVTELVHRKYNRLTEKQLREQSYAMLDSEKDLTRLKKRREERYKELAQVLEDQETVDRISSHIELQKNLHSGGRFEKVADGVNGHADVYKWAFERKK